jgi:glycosyl transferase family 25
MEHIDAILYINLEYRKDRNEHILNEIHKICTDDSKIHRIDAIKKDNGALGCGLSHIKALEYAVKNEWKTVLILEDDFTCKSVQMNDHITLLFEYDFDVGLLSHNCLKYSNTDNDFVKRVIYSQTASSYIIKKDYIPILLQNMREAMNDMLINGKRHENCIDIHWVPLILKDKWYALYPAIGYQYANHSNIENTYVEYGC